MCQDENILNIFLQKKIKKINCIVKKKKINFFDSLKNKNELYSLKLYIKLIKKIRSLISSLKFPKMKTNFNISIMMSDDDNINFYNLSFFLSSQVNSLNNNFNNSDIIENFYNYKNKSTNNFNLIFINFIKNVNNSNNTKWSNSSYENVKVYAYKSGSTTM